MTGMRNKLLLGKNPVFLLLLELPELLFLPMKCQIHFLSPIGPLQKYSLMDPLMHLFICLSLVLDCEQSESSFCVLTQINIHLCIYVYKSFFFIYITYFI